MIKRINIFSHWWHNVDRLLVSIIVALFLISILLIATASPPIAHRIGLKGSYFIIRQFFYLGIGVSIIFALSLLDYRALRRIATIGFCLNIILLCLVPLYGAEIKGARRWLSIFGISIQPSELIKPCFWVIVGWILSFKQLNPKFPSLGIMGLIYLPLVLLLVIQPDVGTLVLISCIVTVQIFTAGLPIIWILVTGVVGIVGVVGAYLWFPHVSHRINTFLNADSEQNYQVHKALEAFSSGGLYGKGLGEGTVKQHIPDSHTDFIFAVAGEEFGGIICIVVSLLFAIFVIRGYLKLAKEQDNAKSLAGCGILAQLAVQSLINMGVNLHLLPTKGMTLPLISYGGSSMISIAIGLGMLLSFTKHNPLAFKYRVNKLRIPL